MFFESGPNWQELSWLLNTAWICNIVSNYFVNISKIRYCYVPISPRNCLLSPHPSSIPPSHRRSSPVCRTRTLYCPPWFGFSQKQSPSTVSETQFLRSAACSGPRSLWLWILSLSLILLRICPRLWSTPEVTFKHNWFQSPSLTKFTGYENKV